MRKHRYNCSMRVPTDIKSRGWRRGDWPKYSAPPGRSPSLALTLTSTTNGGISSPRQAGVPLWWNARAPDPSVRYQWRSINCRRRLPTAPDPVIPLLAVPYMGETARAYCEQNGVAWLDLSGNGRIVGAGNVLPGNRTPQPVSPTRSPRKAPFGRRGPGSPGNCWWIRKDRCGSAAWRPSTSLNEGPRQPDRRQAGGHRPGTARR